MAKTLNEKELKAGIDNAILSVIDTCGADVDSAISKGMKADPSKSERDCGRFD